MKRVLQRSGRRGFLWSGVGGVAFGAASLVRPARGQPSATGASGSEDPRLRRRLELWSHFAKSTESLVAAYALRRDSSLLVEPLERAGRLAFVRPDRLVLRDDDLLGSGTWMSPEGLVVIPNQAELPRPELTPWDQAPASAWLCQRLWALFGARDESALMRDCRAEVPRGRRPELDLLPLRDSAVRKEIRSLRIRFDPVGGAVERLIIEEAQGDRVRIELSDHRRSPPQKMLDRLFEAPDDGLEN